MSDIVVTPNLFARLALRQHRINEIVFRHAGLPPRVTPQVASYIENFNRARQAEYDALNPAEKLRLQITKARQEVEALAEAAKTAADKAPLLAQAEAINDWAELAAGILEEMADDE